MTLLHDIFTVQAERTPDALAAVVGAETITYGELARRSDAVAATLLALGARPESLIGICLGRSMHMLAAILGVLKAGAAYVPLDPAYPEERLAFMAANAGMEFVVAERATFRRLPPVSAEILFIDETDLTRTLAAESGVTIASQLAYAMYTSGSTGQPKGVLVEHRNIVPFIQWTTRYFSTTYFRYTLCANSLSFDVSIFEIFATFAAGGTLVIANNILDLLVAPPVLPLTMIIAAPSSVAEIVRAEALPATLEAMIFGGERLPVGLAREIYRTTNVRTLYNSWGVTEDSVGSAFISVARDAQEDPPMGAVIEGRSLYLLDSDGVAVASGEPGELYCGGYGVARGYLNRPELDAERFVPNPFGHSPIMYRTGDIARQCENGAFMFIGRNDAQIKLHGRRIELGEIEARLDLHPAVAQAAVVARTAAGRLDMYIVPRAAHDMPPLACLQEYLAATLPAHMIPSVLHIVKAIPVGPTGKIDRAALGSKESVQETVPHNFQAPANAMEETIVRLFGDILERTAVSSTADFFALGGKSLSAARLGTELRRAYPHEVAVLERKHGTSALLKAFTFEATPRYLAAVLQQQEELPLHRDRLYCIQPGTAGKRPLFLFHGVINGEALYCYDLARALGREQPLYALEPHGIDGSAVPTTVEAMANDYVQKIRRVQAHGPYHFMGYCNGGLVAFEAAQQMREAGERIATLVLIATPGHNVRHRIIKSGVLMMGNLLGHSSQQSLLWFLKSRDAVRLTKYRIEYARDRTTAFLRGKAMPALTPEERLQKALSFGPQPQLENPNFRKIVRVMQAYVPQRYDGAITVVWGKDDEYLQYANPRRDWQRVTSELRMHFVDGGHHFLNTDADKLAAYLPGNM